MYIKHKSSNCITRAASRELSTRTKYLMNLHFTLGPARIVWSESRYLYTNSRLNCYIIYNISGFDFHRGNACILKICKNLIFFFFISVRLCCNRNKEQERSDERVYSSITHFLLFTKKNMT